MIEVGRERRYRALSERRRRARVEARDLGREHASGRGLMRRGHLLAVELEA
jgi:hypothetical protein